MPYSIRRHIAYNAWANARVAEALRPVPDAIYFQENKSSFPSIAKTVLHIWGAQQIWLRRMNREQVTTGSAATVDYTKDDSLDTLLRTSEALVDFVSTHDDATLLVNYTYQNLQGKPFEASYEDTLFHVVNHSTYHRGQITTMLRQAGVQHVAVTDLIAYLRALKNE